MHQATSTLLTLKSCVIVTLMWLVRLESAIPRYQPYSTVILGYHVILGYPILQMGYPD